ncbi:MAG: histidinol-phosphate aminotransferase family protein [Chloroflexi bacterium]|nr:histidinol-phosphate aminotransferase family protein [Chloroflexota bacterium]
MKSAVHGGLDLEELRARGLEPGEVLDFSSNASPLGPPPGVAEAIAGVDLSRYPDPQCRELRRALAERTGAPVERILVGNGSSELISLLAWAYAGPGAIALVLSPTFSEYSIACRATGAQAAQVTAKEERGFLWDMEEVSETIARQKPSLVFLCNPNSPTGVYLPQREVAALIGAAAPATLVLDEAFVAFVEQPWDALPLLERGNIVVVRSLTKEFAIAGLRLGYLVAREDVADRLAALQPRWSVNALAQTAGLAALRDQGYPERMRRLVREAKAYLERELCALGLAVTPSHADFLLVKVGDAARMRDALLERRIAVRDCASFGLPQHIRIAARASPECRRLVAALKEALAATRLHRKGTIHA